MKAANAPLEIGWLLKNLTRHVMAPLVVKASPTAISLGTKVRVRPVVASNPTVRARIVRRVVASKVRLAVTVPLVPDLSVIVRPVVAPLARPVQEESRRSSLVVTAKV